MTERERGRAAVASAPFRPGPPCVRSHTVTTTPQTANAATPVPITFRHVRSRQAPFWPSSAPSSGGVGEACSVPSPVRRSLCCTNAVARTIGKPMMSRVNAIAANRPGRSKASARTSTTWSATQAPAAYSPTTCHSERFRML